MRLTVSQIRILMLVVNIVLALGVPAYAVYGYLRSGQGAETLAPVDLASLRPGEGVASRGPDGPSQMQAVANKLQPKPPPPPPPKPDLSTEVATGEQEPPSEDEAYSGPGPLGDQGWAYHGYILHADPRETFVILKKSDPAAAGAAAAGVTPSSRVNTRIQASSRLRTRTSPRAAGVRVQGPQDQISFHIKDRVFKNDELGLHFHCHKADRSHFVYWVPGDSRLYALEFKHESTYDQDPSKGLRPRPDENPQPSGEEGGEAEKVRLIKIFTKGEYKDFTEEDYEALLKEHRVAVSSEPIKDSRPRIGPSSQAAPPRGAGVRPAGAGAIDRRPPTADEKEELRKAIQAIPKEQQEELIKGLQGIKID